MKPTILIAALAAILSLTGCKTSNSNLGPALVRVGVSTTVGYELIKHPQAKAGVQAGAALVCAAANGTNVAPAAIIDAVNTYGKLTPESFLILNGAIAIYTLSYNALIDPTTEANPYALALCNGLNDALVYAPAGNLASPRALQTWPQLRYP